jgi:hypothetical protein
MFGVSGLRAQVLLQQARAERFTLRTRLRYAVWALFWVAGHVVGGLLVGVALGAGGALLALGGYATAGIVLSAVCLAAALHQWQVLWLPLPHLRRQVPRHWMLRLPWSIVAVGYGLQLGCGVATHVRTTATYAALAAALLAGSGPAGGVVMGLYGLARAVPAVLLGPRLQSPQAALGFACAVDAREASVARLNGLVLLVAAVVLAGLWWRGLNT